MGKGAEKLESILEEPSSVLPGDSLEAYRFHAIDLRKKLFIIG